MTKDVAVREASRLPDDVRHIHLASTPEDPNTDIEVVCEDPRCWSLGRVADRRAGA